MFENFLKEKPLAENLKRLYETEMSESNRPKNTCNFSAKNLTEFRSCRLAAMGQHACFGTDAEKEGCLFWKILIQLQIISGQGIDLTVYPIGNPIRKMEDELCANR
jgi:hypothetical protein